MSSEENSILRGFWHNRHPGQHKCWGSGQTNQRREDPDSYGMVPCPACGTRVRLVDFSRYLAKHWVDND